MSRMRHSLAIGAMIAGLGPPLGFCVVLISALMDRGPDAAFYLLRFPDVVVMPYLLGGLPAALAGIVAGWRVWRRGVITLRFWLAATAIAALVPSALFLGFSQPPPAAMLYVTDSEIAAMYVAATMFASLVLRLLLAAIGLLRGQATMTPRT